MQYINVFEFMQQLRIFDAYLLVIGIQNFNFLHHPSALFQQYLWYICVDGFLIKLLLAVPLRTKVNLIGFWG